MASKETRVIKFRAWDTEKKKWMTPEYVYDTLENRARWHPQIGEIFPLMQFTGLQDKNGKDIYEGDIIEFRSAGSRIGEIKWQQQNACFYISYRVGKKHFYSEVKSEAMHGDGTVHILTDTEVIGNIYETPNLLTHEI